MHIDVSRYTHARGSLRARGGGFMATGAACASFTGLFALIGLSMAFNRSAVHPRENFIEGSGVFVFGAIPTLLFALLFARGLRHWSNAGRYDRLVDLARHSPGIAIADAARVLGFAVPKLEKLAFEGAAKGFIAEPEQPVVYVSTPQDMDNAANAMYSPGRTPLLAVLVSYAVGIGAVALMAATMHGKSGASNRGLSLLVGSAATMLTAVLDLVGMVGGIASYSAARRMQPPASVGHSVIAIVMGVLGFVGVLALAALTLLNTF